MHFAVLADIHGNHLALEAVLADIDRQGISDILNLGDSFSGPLRADLVAGILMKRPILTVCGNHDRYLVERDSHEEGSWELPVVNQMTPAILDWIRALPFSSVYRDKVFLCHASPASDTEDWLEFYANQRHAGLQESAHIERIAQGVDYPLMLCAHSHVARIVRLADGRQILNPGSVGCPAFYDDTPGQEYRLEAGHANACYATVTVRDGRFHISLHAVPYDTETMADIALAAGAPDWAQALCSGRMG